MIRVRVVFDESVTIFFHREPGKLSTAVVLRMLKAFFVLSLGRCHVVLHSLASSELRLIREELPVRATSLISLRRGLQFAIQYDGSKGLSLQYVSRWILYAGDVKTPR